MAVIFSKLCGKNEGFYKAVEGVLTSHIMDVDTGKTNDDAVLEAIFRVKKSKKFGERQGGMTEFGDFKERLRRAASLRSTAWRRALRSSFSTRRSLRAL